MSTSPPLGEPEETLHQGIDLIWKTNYQVFLSCFQFVLFVLHSCEKYFHFLMRDEDCQLGNETVGTQVFFLTSV